MDHPSRRSFLKDLGLGTSAFSLATECAQAGQLPGRPPAADLGSQASGPTKIMAIAAHPGDGFFAMPLRETRSPFIVTYQGTAYDFCATATCLTAHSPPRLPSFRRLATGAGVNHGGKIAGLPKRGRRARLPERLHIRREPDVASRYPAGAGSLRQS